jgi:hypothetical protein
MQKQARFEANAIHSTSEGYKKITGELYDAQKAASDLDKSLDKLRNTIKGMGGNYRGGPGRPGDSGIGDLFPVEGAAGSSKVDGLDKLFRGPVKDEPGSGKAEGLDDLFPGPGQEKKPDSNNEKKSDEDTQRRLRESYENFDRTYKKIQEDLKSANEHVRQIRENTRVGMKALEDGIAALRGSGGAVPNTPDIPIIPDYQPLFGEDGKPKEKSEEKKK